MGKISFSRWFFCLFMMLFLITVTLCNRAIADETILIYDAKSGTNEDLDNFRKMSDEFRKKEGKPPSRIGLNCLKASGSAQFSEIGLKAIKERLSGKKIVIVDLREECHGFINGSAVSWKGDHNRANMGKSLKEIEKDENLKLSNVLKVKKTMITRIKTVGDVDEESREEITVSGINNEKEICNATVMGYLRLPVTDHTRPTDKVVDDFIKYVQTMPKDVWLHFHCRKGKGRTATFLAMYDMMKNSDKVSCQDIIKRQYLLGGSNLDSYDSPDSWKHQLGIDRKNFINLFYQYCKENKDNFKTPWTFWLTARSKK